MPISLQRSGFFGIILPQRILCIGEARDMTKETQTGTKIIEIFLGS
jgi:hypothetical protein